MVDHPFKNVRRVHAMGVGGIGVSALARLFLAWGARVTGCDGVSSNITDALQREGIDLAIGHDASHAKVRCDLLLTSAAVPENQPELAAFRKKGVRVLAYPEALGEISRSRETIVIAGTHGKSTTTAMTGLILETGGVDPLVVVGSLVPQFTLGNLRVGEGPLVVEGCEYRRHFLHLTPKILVITNIEIDHTDYYRDLDDVRSAFQALVDKLPSDGVLVLNVDDPGIGKLRLPKCRVVTFGKSSIALVKLDEIPVLKISGEFNRFNAAAALAVARVLDVADDMAFATLTNYTGIWRRFEKMGEWQGATLIADYAHHPTAIKATIKAAHETYPNRRLVVIFQPHQRQRTESLLPEFAASLIGPEVVILPEIYDVAGREDGLSVSSRDIMVAMQARPDFGREGLPTVRFAPTWADLEKMTPELIEPGDVVLIMGAGDIDAWARAFFSHV